MHGPDTWDYTHPSWTPPDPVREPRRQAFTLTVPLVLTVTSNRRADTWKRKRVKDEMRALTRTAARLLEPCGSATIWIGITKRTQGTYDPVNLTDTFKGCIDELVSMGILDDDDYHHVNGPWLWHKSVNPKVPQGHLKADVWLHEYENPEVPF